MPFKICVNGQDTNRPVGNSSLKLLLLLIHLTQHNLFILTQHDLLFIDYETSDLDMHGGSCVPTMNYIQGPQSHVQTRCLVFFLIVSGGIIVSPCLVFYPFNIVLPFFTVI